MRIILFSEGQLSLTEQRGLFCAVPGSECHSSQNVLSMLRKIVKTFQEALYRSFHADFNDADFNIDFNFILLFFFWFYNFYFQLL